MSKQELLNYIRTNPNGCLFEGCFSKNFPEMYEEYLKWNIPDEAKTWKFKQKLWHFLHDDFDFKFGLCSVCGKRCKLVRFNDGYRQTCSIQCSNSSQSHKDKERETKLKRYGNEKFNNFEKCKQTRLVKYGDEYYNNRDKAKKTCIDRYGTEYYSQSEEGLKQIKKTWETKSREEHGKKSIEGCLKKYGVNSYTQTDEYKEKCNEYQEKIKQTCFERYGVENYAQTHEFAKQRRKHIQCDNLMFDSSYEVTVYQYCKENNIPCIYQPNIQFNYFYEGKKHVYQPDFLINNRLYEVKGEQFFEGNKMINPFDRTQDGLFEAKHQCMLNNNVIILRKQEIDNLIQNP